MNRKSIFQKLRRNMLLSSAAAALAVTLAAVVCILVMRSSVMDISGRLGASAADDSKAALSTQMEDSLLRLAGNKAAISDEKLAMVANMVKVISDSATAVASDPEGSLPKAMNYPDAANAGTTVAQLRLPEGVDLASVSEEVGLLGNLSPLLCSEHDTLDYVASVYLGSERGVSISADKDSDKKTNVYDPRSRSWYTEGKAAGGLIWTDIFVDNSGRGLGITCAKPYYDASGQLQGVVGAGMLLDILKEIVIETRLGETGYAFIANGRGEIIIADSVTIAEDGSINSQALSALLPAATASRIRSGESGIERVSIEGDDYFIAYSPMQTLPWSLAVVMSVEEVIAPATLAEQNIMGMTQDASAGIDQMILIALAVFAAALVLTFIGNTIMSKRLASGLAQPIIELSDGAGVIGAGNLDHRLNVKTGDELETLSDSFNSMIDNIKRITAEKERIGAELNVATQIQASMLPCIFPAFPEREEFDIYASMQPAKEVGGDFYDFFLIDDNTLAVVMADVSGKGVPAALFMVIAKTLIKNNAQLGKSPAEVFETVNRLLCENNEAGMFVTAFMGYLDITSGKFTFVNAGHNPPLISVAGKFDWLKAKRSFILAGMDGMPYKQNEVVLKPGDELFLYTDGVTEAMNPENKLFTEARLLEIISTKGGGDLKELLYAVKLGIDEFASGAEQADDITMLSLRYKGTVSSIDELVVRAALENIKEVQDFIAMRMEECPAKIRNKISIAVDEIFANIARYAYDESGGGVTVRVFVGEDVYIEFEDSGAAYNPLAAEDPDVSLPVEEREVGGLGVFMVKKLMDSVEYRRDGMKNILRIRKKLE